MEQDEKSIVERLEAATTLLERTLSWLEERQGALIGRGGEDLGDHRAEPRGRPNWPRNWPRSSGSWPRSRRRQRKTH